MATATKIVGCNPSLTVTELISANLTPNWYNKWRQSHQWLPFGISGGNFSSQNLNTKWCLCFKYLKFYLKSKVIGKKMS